MNNHTKVRSTLDKLRLLVARHLNFNYMWAQETHTADGFISIIPALDGHLHIEYLNKDEFPLAYTLQGFAPGYFCANVHDHPQYLSAEGVAANTEALGGELKSKFSSSDHKHYYYVPLTMTPDKADFLIAGGKYVRPDAVFAGLIHSHKYVTRGSRVTHTETLSTRI